MFNTIFLFLLSRHCFVSNNNNYFSNNNPFTHGRKLRPIKILFYSFETQKPNLQLLYMIVTLSSFYWLTESQGYLWFYRDSEPFNEILQTFFSSQKTEVFISHFLQSVILIILLLANFITSWFKFMCTSY